jgi:hypothetical protein
MGVDAAWWPSRSSKPHATRLTSGWVGSIPMHSRHSIRLDFRTDRRTVTHHPIVLVVALLLGAMNVAEAQTDSTPRPPIAASADTVHSPITPKRAFLSSLFVPGSAQNILGRHRAAAALLAVEVISIGMIRESGADLREARQQFGDSIVMTYVDARGVSLSTPTLQRRRFGNTEIHSRRSHVEDWVALLIANHLFAASDAFVSANLWDVAAHVTVRGAKDQLMIGGRISWR